MISSPAAVDSSDDEHASGSKMFDGRDMQNSTTDGGTGAGSLKADTEASTASLPGVHPHPLLPLERASGTQLTPNNAGRSPSFEDAAHFSSDTLPRQTASRFWHPGAGTMVDGTAVGPPPASRLSSTSALPPAPPAAAVPVIAQEVLPGTGNGSSRSSCTGAVGTDVANPAMHYRSGERRSSRRSAGGDQVGPRSRESIAF